MKRLILIAVALSLPSMAAAESGPGHRDFELTGGFAGAGVDLAHPVVSSIWTAGMAIRWRVGALMGEPVIYCDAAWTLKPTDFAGGIPVKVMETAVLYQVRVIAKVAYGPGYGRSTATISCDPGAMAKPFIGSIQRFKALPAARRKKYISFNVAGSPSWDKLFKGPGGYLSAEDAKSLMRALLAGQVKLEDAQGQGGFAGETFASNVVGPQVSFAEIQAWVATRRDRETARKHAQVVAQADKQRAAAERAAEAAQAKRFAGNDYWDTPANPETSDEQTARLQRDHEHRNLVAQHARERHAIEAERAAVNKRVAEAQAAMQRRLAAVQKQPAASNTVCTRAATSFQQCIEKRCPVAFTHVTPFRLWHRDDGPCDAECQRRREEARREAERRAAEEARRKAEAARRAEEEHQRCVQNAQPICAQFGSADDKACSQKLDKSLRAWSRASQR